MMHRLCMNPHIEELICKQKKSFPNSLLPVIIYRGALALTTAKNLSAELPQ
jgi:hypothetical protein